MRVDPANPDDKWFVKALEWNKQHQTDPLEDATYEAFGKHFNGNPYNLEDDRLIQHGILGVLVKRDFDSIRDWLGTHNREGLVFWLNGEPVCKIKRTDFGLKWPVPKED